MGQRRGVGGLPIPLVVLCTEYPAFAPGSSEVAESVGLWYLVAHNLQAVILILCSFFVFYCLRRCLSRCKDCRKVSQVPVCFTNIVLGEKSFDLNQSIIFFFPSTHLSIILKDFTVKSNSTTATITPQLDLGF